MLTYSSAGVETRESLSAAAGGESCQKTLRIDEVESLPVTDPNGLPAALSLPALSRVGSLRNLFRQAIQSPRTMGNIRFSTVCYFPLTVMPMKNFMQLDILEDYHVMRQRNLTVQDVDRSAKILFISHQWLGYTHPDENSVHLKRLQEVLGALLSGKAHEVLSDEDLNSLSECIHLASCFRESGFTAEQAAFAGANTPRVDTDSSTTLQQQLEGAYIWLDYFSIPQITTSNQDKQARPHVEIDTTDLITKSTNETASQPARSATQDINDAVNSIPYYVERCSFFFVVAPKALHTDGGHICDLISWRARGWCRLEEWANVLSLNSKCPVIVTENNVMVQGWEDHVVLVGGTREGAVACGEFTCCQLGHRVVLPSIASGGKVITELKCDIAGCKQVLNTMWRDKLDYARKKNFKVMERYLVLTSFHMFAPNSFSESWTGGPLLDNTTPEMRLKSIKALNESMNDHLPQGKRGGVLSLAAMAGNPKTLQALLDAGEDASQRDVAGRTALERAALIGNKEAIMVLISCDLAQADLDSFINSAGSKRSNITPLMRAAKQGHAEIVSMLLSFGADVNAQRKDTATTALHEAAVHGRDMCVKALLQGGANLRARDKDGCYALHYAARGWSLFCDQHGKVDVARRLITATGDVNAQNTQGQTALDVAKLQGHTGFVELITRVDKAREHAEQFKAREARINRLQQRVEELEIENSVLCEEIVKKDKKASFWSNMTDTTFCF